MAVPLDMVEAHIGQTLLQEKTVPSGILHDPTSRLDCLSENSVAFLSPLAGLLDQHHDTLCCVFLLFHALITFFGLLMHKRNFFKVCTFFHTIQHDKCVLAF